MSGSPDQTLRAFALKLWDMNNTMGKIMVISLPELDRCRETEDTRAESLKCV